MDSVARSEAARRYAETPMPDRSRSWRRAEFCVLDFEITGLDPRSDEILSYGTVTVAGGRLTLADARHQLVRPARMPSAETIRIHGLREADLLGAPPLEQALGGLLEAITGRAIVAHAAVIERSFLRAALDTEGIELRNPFVDTAAMAGELGRRTGRFGRGRSMIGLSELARSLGLPVHRPHHADGDALTTAQAFLALATHLEGGRELTLGELEAMEGTSPRRSLLARLRRPGAGS